MTHRILLRGVVIDVPSEQLPATRRFWSGALLTESRVVPGHSEFIGFSEPAALANVGLQDVGDSPAAVHLDIETDDVEAEVARLLLLGAREKFRHRSWVVMSDPAGIVFCVTPPDSDEFDARARIVTS